MTDSEKLDLILSEIAENFIEHTKKLNQAIPVADKNLAYEVKVKQKAVIQLTAFCML